MGQNLRRIRFAQDVTLPPLKVHLIYQIVLISSKKLTEHDIEVLENQLIVRRVIQGENPEFT